MIAPETGDRAARSIAGHYLPEEAPEAVIDFRVHLLLRVAVNIGRLVHGRKTGGNHGPDADHSYEHSTHHRDRHPEPPGAAQRAEPDAAFGASFERRAAGGRRRDNNDVHCVVLRGAGPHFCAGADLSEFSTQRGPEYRGRQEIDDDVWRLEQGQRLRVMLFDMHKPVIAQWHGSLLASAPNVPRFWVTSSWWPTTRGSASRRCATLARRRARCGSQDAGPQWAKYCC